MKYGIFAYELDQKADALQPSTLLATYCKVDILEKGVYTFCVKYLLTITHNYIEAV